MDDVAVLLEHVDLLNGLDGLDVELLQRRLELLVVGAGAGGRPLDLAAGRSLATANALDSQSFDRWGFDKSGRVQCGSRKAGLTGRW